MVINPKEGENRITVRVDLTGRDLKKARVIHLPRGNAFQAREQPGTKAVKQEYTC